MRFRFWPSTLRVQLILVVAGAVAVSNIGVAFYYYQNSEAQARNFNIDRHDRPRRGGGRHRQPGDAGFAPGGDAIT